MQPREVRQLDPLFAHEMHYAPFPEREQLHQATSLIDPYVDQLGQTIDRAELDEHVKVFFEETLGIDMEEAFFKAKLLPAHETSLTAGGILLHSRLLVIDTRNPTRGEAFDDPAPAQRNRAYFVLLYRNPSNDDGPRHIVDSDNILPFYIVNQLELMAQDTPEEKLVNASSTVLHVQSGALPINDTRTVQQSRDPQTYEILAGELNRAVEKFRLASKVGRGLLS